MINRFRWHAHRIDPTVDPAPKSLKLAKTRHVLATWLEPLTGIDAEIARDVLADIDRVTPVINDLEKRITALVTPVAPSLLAMPGCGPLSAAKIVGETAGVDRFRSEACFAMHAGVAPIPVWSGNTAGRVRMTRTGNRQLNTALHRIAVTQIRIDGPGRDYYRKRLAAGDSKTEALRCLKRRLARTVFHHLKTDQTSTARACTPAAA
jgi:transposase